MAGNTRRAEVGWDKDLESVPEQQIVIKRIVEMHKQGMTLSGIATNLNTEGVNSCLTLNKNSDKVQAFYGKTIKRILMKEWIIKDEKIKRQPLQQRIISHHKPLESVEIVSTPSFQLEVVSK